MEKRVREGKSPFQGIMPEFTEEELYLLKECDFTWDEQKRKLNLHYSEPNFYTPHALEHRKKINELMDSLAAKIGDLLTRIHEARK